MIVSAEVNKKVFDEYGVVMGFSNSLAILLSKIETKAAACFVGDPDGQEEFVRREMSRVFEKEN